MRKTILEVPNEIHNQAASSQALTLSDQRLILLLLPVAVNAQIQITLKNSFIEKFKDRATIDSTFTVDKAHKSPNPGSKDGDLHVAGRAPEIGLPTVSEIMNAKDEDGAVQTIHSAEQTHKSV